VGGGQNYGQRGLHARKILVPFPGIFVSSYITAEMTLRCVQLVAAGNVAPSTRILFLEKHYREIPDSNLPRRRSGGLFKVSKDDVSLHRQPTFHPSNSYDAIVRIVKNAACPCSIMVKSIRNYRVAPKK